MADTVTGDLPPTANGMTGPSVPTANNTDLPQSFEFPSHLPTPPFINVGGIPNFRDLGGYLTASSYFSSGQPSSTTPTMVRKNFLYRCAHPQLVTARGKQQLTDELGVRHFFDFRSGHEIKKLSASIPATAQTDATRDPESQVLQVPGTKRHFVPVYENEGQGPEAIATKVMWYSQAAAHVPDNTAGIQHPYSEGFVNAYRDIALHATKSSRDKAAYTTILKHIASHPDEPIVFHCTAGKDRTGVLAALLLRLAGVDDQTIAWEYALTEPGLGSWRPLFIDRIARGGLGQAGAPSKRIIDEHGREVSITTPVMTKEEAARIVGSRAYNMRAFLRLVVDAEFGGAERYFVERCGLTNEEVEALRRSLVVPVSEENAREVVMPRNIAGWTPDGGVERL